ncbi:MAG: acetate--CoA ligase [Candidatus Binatus sp.]|jgi:acetyl-CoA synthetase|uniref:acetate--CoA ligase n=1 Tax=Candidatus Binatus sp. TaxID=2811406 RepID=UPI003C744ACB
MASTEATHIDSTLTESRKFPPSAEFSAKAWVKSPDEYQALYRRADTDPEGFWAECARNLHWFKPFGKTLEWNFPHAKWFVGGTINASYNCLDRHLDTPRRNKAALIWEGEPGDSRVLTYQMLADEVGRCANALKSLGVKDGDRVAIYMPLVPEAAIAMLACARIGAIHSVVFGGFSSEALADRINDAEAKVCITADGGWRRGQVVELKQNVDDALKKCTSIQKVLVLKRVGNKVEMRKGRDVWWDELVPAQSPKCEAAHLDSEHPLFTLYTSGTTGKPKGVVHTTGGYLTHVLMTMRWVFDLKDEDIYWCTADIGWVTGHSYSVYGPLLAGATVVMYEGAPNFPENDRFWQVIEKYHVSIFYTAPTAIRTFIKWGDEWVKKHDLSSLRLLGSVGEPINPSAWMWYREVIGGERCPIVDTWWQTETGGIMISPMPGATATKPGSATFPLPGIAADVVTREGKSVGANEGGLLIVRKPWPGMLRTIYRDPERYKSSYFSQIEGAYLTGDGARRDQDGYIWIMGRVDDVIKVSGHRLGTMEIESALVSYSAVAEAACVGRPDDVKGECVVAFVTLEGGHKGDDKLREQLRAHVVKEIGALARPDDIRFTDALPKTRSGKIMRRLLRQIASGDQTLGDTTTLEDLSVLSKLRDDDD